MTTELNRERQLQSGNENVEIRYVNSSFGAGTSASSPGVHRHICIHYVYTVHTSIYIYAFYQPYSKTHMYIHINIFICMPSISRTENLQVCKKLNFGCFENMKKCLASVFWAIKKTLKQDGCKATLHFSYHNI